MRPTRPTRDCANDDPFLIGTEPSEDVVAAAFWDYQLCPPPPETSGAEFVRRIRDAMYTQYAGRLVLFKVYTTTDKPIPETFKIDLRNSGIQICEDDGTAADKIRRTVDILTWGFTISQPAMVLFISSDSDFASVISALGSTQCSVGLLVPPNSPSSLLRNHATVHLEWDEIFNLKSSDETITESLIDLSQEDHATPRGSTHDAHFPWLSRRIEIKAPDHHSLGILQHPLLGSPCQKPTLKKTGTLHALSVASPGCHTSSSPGHSGQSPTTTLTNLDRRLRSFSCFEHLVYVLKDLTAQTSSEWHPWGKVAEMLLERDPEAFRRLGVWRFKSYVKIAKEEANIVSTKDPRGGDGEVSLNPRELWTVAAI